MKIEEARTIYHAQIMACRDQKNELVKQREELQKKMDMTKEGNTVYAEEAATLELSIQQVDKKQDAYQQYMDKLLEKWSAVVNMESSKQQGEAMQEYVEDIGKILEVARRIMKGGIVPATDEKKLMDYSMEMYQAAKNIGAMMRNKEREEYKSLWEDDEEETECVDPMEVADQTEAVPGAPEVTMEIN